MSAIRERSIAQLKAWVEALRCHASPVHARIATGPARATYHRVWDELQGFARPLWGMAALAASGEGHRLGTEVWNHWRDGLVNGTDSGHPEYWDVPEDKSQAFCEMPAIALSLLWARREMWSPLDAAAQARILDWLEFINCRHLNQNNWLWFRVIVNGVLLRLDSKRFDAGELRRDLEVLEAMYERDGWYVDGRFEDSRTADCYIPEAMHFYGLIATDLLADQVPQHADRWLERARLFAQQWQYMQASDGAMVAWGRSLTYRWTPAAFWSVCALVDLESLPWPIIAGCWRRQRAWWEDKEICREDGCLALGYTYPNERVAEPYIAHTSPYWLAKAFVALAKPPEHPFWAVEEEYPVPRPPVLPFPGAGGILCGTTADPLFLLVGQHSTSWMPAVSARWMRFAYDARHGFEIPAGDEPPSPDSAFLVRREGTSAWCERMRPIEWKVTDAGAEVVWSPLEGVLVRTLLTPCGIGHRREHVITTNVPLEFREGGFPCPCGEARIDGNQVSLEGEGLCSRITSISGNATPSVLEGIPNANLIHRRTRIPMLEGRLPAGRHQLVCHVDHAR